MSIQEDDAYDGTTARRSQRRKQAVVGVAGAAAVLGGAAFFVTEAVTHRDDAAEPPVVVAPVATQRSDSPAPTRQAPSSAPASREPAAKASRKPSPTPSVSATTKSAEQRVREAREKGERDGVEVQRPLPVATAPPGLQVTESGNLKEDGGTMRVVSAKGDLTGFRELAWVADEGEPVGSATCTQTFRFANKGKAERKPNLMICWRTSDAKSVYTVTVDLGGKPSKQESVAALAKQWSKLG